VVLADFIIYNYTLMYSVNSVGQPTSQQQRTNGDGGVVLSGTLRSSVFFFKRNLRARKYGIAWLSVGIIGVAFCLIAMIGGWGSWRMILPLTISFLFVIGWVVYKIIDTVTILKQKVDWLESIHNDF
jgi:FtsH-binding integral membrane protein